MATFDRPAAAAARPTPPASRPRPRTPHPFARVSAAEPAPFDVDRLHGVVGLLLLAVVAFLAVALATFDPADPPAGRVFPPPVRLANACGLLGSTVAGALLATFGHAAWWVVALLAVFDVHLLRRRPLGDLPLRAVGAVIATLGICTLLALLVPGWVARPVWGAGGRLGATGRFLADAWLAHTGAVIAATALAFGGIWIACDALVGIAARAVVRAAAALTGLAAVAGVALGGLIPSRRGTPHASVPVAAAAAAKRLQSAAPAMPGDDDDTLADDTLADDGPTIRVRRRAPEPVAAGADDDDDSFDGGDDDAALDEASEHDVAPGPVAAAAAVPIRSLASRRKPVELLDLAPDPAADYELPALDVLLPSEHLHLEEQEQEVRDRARVLEKTFADFGFKVRVVEIETGPVISQYEIELEAGLRLAKIANLADDLAIALRVPSVRIVAPIPGKNSVGIEVPNTTRQMVRLREVIEETQAKSRSMKIPIYLGKDVAGNPMVVDMASMPHLLIAGRTGTGKSVCLNSIIVSMLMTRRPDEVRMLLIDPKMVELTPYKSLPHLMHPVVTDMKKAEAILAWAVQKMEERYALLAKVGVRHLTQYNQIGREELIRRINPANQEEADAIPTTMPFIVMIADEIADMMM
ncbi:MAG: DNA translocase FtsK 4TM domain-containing protein, partial [Planctomycetaceae bacterium]